MKNTLVLLMFLLLTSCNLIFPKVALKRAGIFDTKSELMIIESKNQRIIFIGMHHFGKKEFYDDVANKIDSLQKLNYTIFYENVGKRKETDSLTAIKNFKKLRKLMGFFPIQYIDTTTNKIENKINYKGKHKLINQPRYPKLGVDSITAVKADIDITELILEFEKKNGDIKLDSCDLKTKLTEKDYKCKKVNKDVFREFKNKYLGNFREAHLAEVINKSNKNKVLVIYGDAHFWGLFKEMKHLDKDFNITKYKTILNHK